MCSGTIYPHCSLCTQQGPRQPLDPSLLSGFSQFESGKHVTTAIADLISLTGMSAGMPAVKL